MKAYEFPLAIGPDGSVRIPQEVAKSLTPNQTGRLILLVSEGADENKVSWRTTTTEQFLKGYGEIDSAYDRM
ncbi:MAG: hypothetical protein HY897_06630 [Deltaproteobacteria bacterium]|nr:hypothetical protein [Deltaproteobacteria bacterium]